MSNLQAADNILDDGVELNVNELAAFDELYDELFSDYFSDEVINSFSHSGLIHICGYVSSQLKTRINCKDCLEVFRCSEISSDASENPYFVEINRGGLSVPANLCLQLGKLAYLVMAKLICEKYETAFVAYSNQRKLIIHILEQSLFLLDIGNEECGICGLSLIHISEPTRPY